MSNKSPAKVTGPPGRPVLPPQAEAEILDRLFTNMRISSGEIAAILEKYDVCGDVPSLQASYRKRLGQRLMASLREESWMRAANGRCWPMAASTWWCSAATTSRS